MNQQNKEQEYQKVLDLLDHLKKKYQNLGMNAIETSIVSLLKNNVSGLFFVGFHEVINDMIFNSTLNKHLEVGPYYITIVNDQHQGLKKGEENVDNVGLKQKFRFKKMSKFARITLLVIMRHKVRLLFQLQRIGQFKVFQTQFQNICHDFMKSILSIYKEQLSIQFDNKLINDTDLSNLSILFVTLCTLVIQSYKE